MSRFIKGDVILANYGYYDDFGLFTFKVRPFVIIDIEEEFPDNIVVICSTKTHKSLIYRGKVVLKDSEENKDMNLLEDTFIYLDKTVILTNKEILRRIGKCPIIDELIDILNS